MKEKVLHKCKGQHELTLYKINLHIAKTSLTIDDSREIEGTELKEWNRYAWITLSYLNLTFLHHTLLHNNSICTCLSLKIKFNSTICINPTYSQAVHFIS
ncbi:hypothetical protein H5410_046699, partial [Solanum commersonii]